MPTVKRDSPYGSRLNSNMPSVAQYGFPAMVTRIFEVLAKFVLSTLTERPSDPAVDTFRPNESLADWVVIEVALTPFML